MPRCLKNTVELDEFETSTITGALLLLQQAKPEDIPADIEYHLSNLGECTLFSSAEISALIDKINTTY